MDDSWFGPAEICGFAITSLFGMHHIAVFEIGRDRWLHGYLPSNNDQATVTVYELLIASSLSDD